jgi:hypothetical protein
MIDSELHSFTERLIARLGSLTAQPEVFNPLALELFSLQYRTVLPYQRYCDRLGRTPDRISNWTEIPTVPTAAFREFDLTSLPEGERSVTFHSSGTTRQQPSRHFHHRRSLQLYEASLEPWFGSQVLPDRFKIRLLSLVPPAHEAPHSSLAHMLTTLLARRGSADSLTVGSVATDGTWHLDRDRLMVELAAVATGDDPVLLAGTASAFADLIVFLQTHRQSYQLPTGSRIMETGGYKGRSHQLPAAQLHRALSSALGIPTPFVLSEYGMSELSSQAYSRVAGELGESRFRFPPWCAVRVWSPETSQEVAEGEVGLLQVYDLANVYSVSAIQTEDLARRRGLGFEYVGRASGAEPRGCSWLQA